MPIRVAIVEAHSPLRADLVALFTKTTGFACVAACRTAETALVALPKAKPQVVVMDIRLPGMSGVECVRLLKRSLPSTQFLMLTATEDPDLVFQSIVAGATGCLLKKTPMAELLDAVRELHRGGSPMSPSISRKAVLMFAEVGRALAVDDRLTWREGEILRLLARGCLYKEIAEVTGLSYHTVRAHVRNIYGKLQVTSREGAIRAMRKRSGV